MSDKKATYITTYCNFPHRLIDGKPVEHECYVLPPASLQAEREDRYADAIALTEAAKPLRYMRRGVRR